MSKETTVDAKGNLISEAIKSPTYTVQFGKKVGKPNYGNEDFSIFAQVEVDPSDDEQRIVEKLNDAAALVKSVVYKQLGLMAALDTVSGIVTCIEADVPKAAPAAARSAAPAARGGGAPRRNGPREVPEALWRELMDSPQNFFDNAEKKASGQYKATAADFTHKDSRAGLWLKDAPEFYEEII